MSHDSVFKVLVLKVVLDTRVLVLNLRVLVLVSVLALIALYEIHTAHALMSLKHQKMSIMSVIMDLLPLLVYKVQTADLCWHGMSSYWLLLYTMVFALVSVIKALCLSVGLVLEQVCHDNKPAYDQSIIQSVYFRHKPIETDTQTVNRYTDTHT